MSTQEKTAGKIGIITFKGLFFEVVILDVVNKYGRDRYLVEPVAGKGKVWVQNIQIEK